MTDKLARKYARSSWSVMQTEIGCVESNRIESRRMELPWLACVWLESYSNNRTLCALHSESRVLRASIACFDAIDSNFQCEEQPTTLGMLHYVLINFLPIHNVLETKKSIYFVFVERVIKHFNSFKTRLVMIWIVFNVKVAETSSWLHYFDFISQSEHMRCIFGCMKI